MLADRNKYIKANSFVLNSILENGGWISESLSKLNAFQSQGHIYELLMSGNDLQALSSEIDEINWALQILVNHVIRKEFLQK